MLIWGFATVIGLLNVGTPTDAEYAAAQAQLEQMLADAEQGREQCLEDPGPIPDDVSVEEWCGPEVTEESIGGVEAFLAKAPFDFAGAGTDGALGVAALAAALAFIVGATWIGAEWSTRSIVALLFWVPRRLTVMGTKIAVLVLAAAMFGVLAQAAWLATAGILQRRGGTDEALPGVLEHAAADPGAWRSCSRSSPRCSGSGWPTWSATPGRPSASRSSTWSSWRTRPGSSARTGTRSC